MKGINFQNQNFMNLNQIEPNENSKEENFKGKEISVDFLKENVFKQYKCFENDYTYKLFEKINPNSNWKFIKYTSNGKKLHPFLTIKENGIENGSYIEDKGVTSIIFKGYKESICINIDENYPIKKVIKFYLLRVGEEGNINSFKFIVDTLSLTFNDKTSIKDIFGYRITPTITVLQKKNY